MLSLTILTPALMLLYSVLAVTFQVRPVNWPFTPALQISSLVTGSQLAAGAGLHRHLRRSSEHRAQQPRPALAPSRARLPASRERTSNI
jgi:hypothetical protein